MTDCNANNVASRTCRRRHRARLSVENPLRKTRPAFDRQVDPPTNPDRTHGTADKTRAHLAEPRRQMVAGLYTATLETGQEIVATALAEALAVVLQVSLRWPSQYRSPLGRVVLLD